MSPDANKERPAPLAPLETGVVAQVEPWSVADATELVAVSA
jgi:hypothetical protein